MYKATKRFIEKNVIIMNSKPAVDHIVPLTKLGIENTE